jgi:hypothetical protein
LGVELDKFSDVPIADFEVGDFIDDDFGLSLKLESEKIRQKQLLIEQEVSFFAAIFGPVVQMRGQCYKNTTVNYRGNYNPTFSRVKMT